MNTERACPCGSGRDYAACCGPLIAGERAAESPEALMRSRYTAFTRQALDYLETSLHPAKRHDYDAAGSAKWARDAAWQRLEVVASEADPQHPDRGTVEFRAHSRMDGRPQVHHERAEFRKSAGTWYYYDGRMVSAGQVRRETPKVGRNDPCPCGSGKKYKKCCG